MTPEEDERRFWERVADNWYGSAAGSENGWLADAPSQWAGLLPWARPETEAVGYYRIDTGNPTRDAIASIALNNLGFDNFVRAGMAREEGDWPRYVQEMVGGGAELYIASRSTGGSIVRSVVARGGREIANALRRGAPVVRGGTPLSPITGQSISDIARIFGQVPTGTTATRAGGYTVPVFGPSPVTVSPGVRPITQIRPTQIYNRAIDAASNAATRFSQAGWAGVGRRLNPSRLPGGRFGAALSLLGLASVGAMGLPGSQPRATATEAAGRPSPTDPPPDTPRTIRDVTPVGDPIVDAGNNARNDVAAINRQYNNILRELQGMYQLSETDEERERLRFMLADIEAQRDAGLEAISQGYAQTVAAIQQRGEISRQQTAERAERFGSQLEGYADRTAQRMMLQNINQQQQFRGLGSGSQNPVNEWVGLMSAMAPLQQQYTQRMGDITGEGIDWLAGTVGAQGQAQQADLQRLAAATRSASIMSHQRQVDDRIQREREAQRAAILQTMQMQAGALAGAGSGMLDPFDRLRSIESWASQGYGSGFIEQSLRDTGQTSLTPGELARIEIMNQRYLGEVPGSAATTPLDPSGN